MILAALEKSDGTRKGVRDQVFTAPGITIPAATAMLGRTCAIDPVTGDVNIADFAIEVVRDGKEVTIDNLTVGDS